MKKIAFVLTGIFLVPFQLMGEGPGDDFQKNWPQWRGPLANGVVLYGNPPVEWSESKNVKWKIDIPGKGHSTPIIWGDQIFVLTAIETGNAGAPKQEAKKQNRRGRRRSWFRGNTTSNIHQFAILAINRSDGKILWQKTLWSAKTRWHEDYLCFAGHRSRPHLPG